MERAVDQVEVSRVRAVPEAIAVQAVRGPTAEPGVIPPSAAVPPRVEGLSPPGLASGRTREFDDIPSVVRALLVGYDEV